MGYTHYWRINSKLDSDKFKQFSLDCKKIAEESNVPLSDGLAKKNSKPEFSEKRIWFNGVDEDSHETFLIDPQHIGFEFCKTNMKPYDKVVVACLICFEHYSDVSVSSDGDGEDWREGIELYSKVFPDRKIKCI